jgi:hypothetical protein
MWESLIVWSSCGNNREIRSTVEQGFHCDRTLWQKTGYGYIAGRREDFAREIPYNSKLLKN